MGARTDAALTLFVLAAAFVAFVLANGSLSALWFALGSLATLTFEAIAARDPARVRAHWERPLVQIGAVGLALVGVIVGARVAPSSVLSALMGAATMYVAFLSAVVVRRRR